MQRLEVSGAVRPIYESLGVKRLIVPALRGLFGKAAFQEFAVLSSSYVWFSHWHFCLGQCLSPIAAPIMAAMWLKMSAFAAISRDSCGTRKVLWFSQFICEIKHHILHTDHVLCSVCDLISVTELFIKFSSNILQFVQNLFSRL